MNTASQDLDKHLNILKDRLTHPTDYELALPYFLEEFAGDLGFHGQGEDDEAAHLRVVLGFIVSKMLDRTIATGYFRAFYLPAHGFFHGRLNVEAAYLIFFYFERANIGLAALMRLDASQQLIARFQIPEPAARNPKHN